MELRIPNHNNSKLYYLSNDFLFYFYLSSTCQRNFHCTLKFTKKSTRLTCSKVKYIKENYSIGI